MEVSVLYEYLRNKTIRDSEIDALAEKLCVDPDTLEHFLWHLVASGRAVHDDVTGSFKTH